MIGRKALEVLAGVPSTLAPFGGRLVATDGELDILEGEWPHPRLVIIEFPDGSAAQAWYRSDAYQRVIGLQLQSAAG